MSVEFLRTLFISYYLFIIYDVISTTFLIILSTWLYNYIIIFLYCITSKENEDKRTGKQQKIITN